MSSPQFSYAQKRRSTRIEQILPLTVDGLGAFREPIHEQASTLSISCHGCTYQSKYQVIEGEIVNFAVGPQSEGSSQYSGRARVKWIQRLGGKDRSFHIGLELEVAGNIWGVASPPSDWFPVQESGAIAAASVGRELRIVSRAEEQLPSAPDAGNGGISHLDQNQTTTASLSALTQLMTGLGEQIQVVASHAATTALADEKTRLLDQVRAQLRDEAIQTMQSVMTNSREEFTRRALKQLSEAHELGARTTYVRWMKKVEQDMESARLQARVQEEEVRQRIEHMAISAIEQVQRSMETLRSEAVDRFASRLRDQVAPLLAESKDALQALAVSEAALKKTSHSMQTGFQQQLANSASESLAKVQDALDKDSAALATKTAEILAKVAEHYEEVARENVQILLLSAGDQMTKIMGARAAELSLAFSTRLEGHTRSYFEFIAKSIAEIPGNASRQPTD